MKEALNKLAATALGILTVILVVFHLGTLRVFSPYSPPHDDAALVDYAMHGGLNSWRQILPQGQKHLLDTYAGGLWGGAMLTQGWIMRRVGVGVEQSKLGGAVCGLLGLIVFSFLIRGLTKAWYAWIGVLCLGFTKPFFAITHSARPEGYVFLAMSLNWYWFFLGQGRVFSAAAGFLGVAALAFHQAAIFFLAPLSVMIFIENRADILASSRLRWWLGGAVLGAVFAIWAIDFDQALRFLRIGDAVTTPPLLRWGWNLGAILHHGLGYLYFSGRQASPWHALLSCFFLSLWMQLRSHARLPPARRQMGLAALFTLLSFILFSASDNSSYLIYSTPLMLMSFLLGIDDLLGHKMSLRFGEQVLLAVLHVLVFSVLLTRFAFLPIISFLACCCVHALSRRALPPWAKNGASVALMLAVPTGIGLFLLPMMSWDFPSRAAYLAQQRPWQFILLLITPWVLMLPREIRINRRILAMIPVEKIFILYCAFNAAALGFNQIQWVRSESTRNHLSDELNKRMISLNTRHRLVAPGELGLHAPFLSFQALESITWAMASDQYDPMQALIEYRPDLVLWPGDKAALEKSLSRVAAGKGRRIRWGRVWAMPSGDWHELEIMR